MWTRRPPGWPVPVELGAEFVHGRDPQLFRLARDAGLSILIVPYKGAGPALTDIVAGHVSALADPLPSSYPHVKGGRLKALAVTSGERIAFMPDVPTMAESGFPGFEMLSWYGSRAVAGLDYLGALAAAALEPAS